MVAHGSGSELLLGDQTVGGYFRQAKRSAKRTMHNSTPLNNASGANVYTPGLGDGSVSLEGWFDATADAVLGGTLLDGHVEPFTLAPEGLAAGKRVLFGMVRESKYDLVSPATDLVGATAELQGDRAGMFAGTSFGVAAGIALAGNITLDRGAGAPTANQRMALIAHSSGTQGLDVAAGAGKWLEVYQSADNASFFSLVGVGARVSWGPGVSASTDYSYPVSHGGSSKTHTKTTIGRYVRVELGAVGAGATPVQLQVSAAFWTEQ